MRLAIGSLSLAAGLFLIGCATAPQQEEPAAGADSLMAVQDASKARFNALLSGDLETFVAMHTDDVVMLPPHAEEILGQAAVRQRMEGRLQSVDYEGTTQSQELRSLGSGVALDWGAYSSRIIDKKTGEEQVDAGSYLTIWQKNDQGKWLVAYDVWNSNRPMPAPEK